MKFQSCSLLLALVLTVARSEPVFEVIFRELKVDVDTFKAARTPVAALIKKSAGVVASREFQAVMDYTTYAAPKPDVFIAVNQYQSMDDFYAAATAIQKTAEYQKFTETFTPSLFLVTKSSEAVQLETLANKAGNQFEFSYRNLAKYSNFDSEAYDKVRAAFVKSLAAKDGVTTQKFLDLDPFKMYGGDTMELGTTVYESSEVYNGLAQSGFFQSPETTAFMGAYPLQKGYLTVECCTELSGEKQSADHADCAKWSAWCSTENEWMKKNCQSTCSSAPQYDSCTIYSAFCGKNEWMATHCKGTCSQGL